MGECGAAEEVMKNVIKQKTAMITKLLEEEEMEKMEEEEEMEERVPEEVREKVGGEAVECLRTKKKREKKCSDLDVEEEEEEEELQ